MKLLKRKTKIKKTKNNDYQFIKKTSDPESFFWLIYINMPDFL